MDDGDKIKDVVARVKNAFLRDLIKEIGKKKFYDLEDEFAKTKKNRTRVVAIVILIFIALFIAGAALLTRYIQKESKNVPVNIADFEEINLKDILDVAKKYENDLKNTQRELGGLIKQRDTTIQNIVGAAENKIELLSNETLAPEEYNKRIAHIRREEKDGIKTIEGDIGNRIISKQKEITEIQERIALYDATLVEKARKQEEVFNQQQKIFEIEMKETVAYYENRIKEIEKQAAQDINSLKTHNNRLVTLLKKNQEEEINRLILKYNPVITSYPVSNLISQKTDPGIFQSGIFLKYRQILSDEGIISSEDFGEHRKKLEEMSIIFERLKEVPYTNSVPQILNQLEYIGRVQIRNYEYVRDRLAETVEAKNSIIAQMDRAIKQYLYSLDYLTKKNRENGYILDSRDPELIILYINRIYSINDGDLGYVFRRDDKFIGTIRFSVSTGKITGSLVELASEEEPLEPFDKILVDLQ